MDTTSATGFKKYTDWLRCNSCWLHINENKSNFHITQCGHVYCSVCVEQAKRKCFQCGETGILSLPLKEPLNPQIAHYFSDPDLLQENVEQAKRFQKSQMELTLKRANEVLNKYQALKQQYISVAKDMKVVNDKYNKLKNIFLTMQKDNKKLVSRSKISTPRIQYQTPPSRHINSNSNYITNNEGFKVPITPRVPKSTGYYSASSGGSNFSN